MHLNLIEAADSAADESWRNINAIDDLAREIIATESHLTIAALQGNAGAGGFGSVVTSSIGVHGNTGLSTACLHRIVLHRFTPAPCGVTYI